MEQSKPLGCCYRFIAVFKIADMAFRPKNLPEQLLNLL
jgi:hypothetical protein